MKNPKLIFAKLCILTFGLALPGFLLAGCKASTTASLSGSISSVENLEPEAEQIILNALTNTNAIIRTKAIEVIADIRRRRLMPKIVDSLSDKSVPVRFSAALAVGDLEYRLAEYRVKQLLKDNDKNVRIAAAYALYKLGSTEKIDIIRKEITAQNQILRANATFLLGKCGDKKSLKLLYWAMRDKSSEHKVSFQAAQAIAILGEEKIYPELWTMLISSFADDRVMGIRAMGALGTFQAKNALITMLDDSVPEVRLTAAEQLGMLNDSIGEPEVLDVFQNNFAADMDKQARQRVYVLAAIAIGQIKTGSLVKFLPQLLKDPSEPVRIAAAKAVFQCTNQKRVLK